MIELRDYQSNAVERLKVNIENLLRSSENEVCIFQAPTGSGKTVMVSEFLKKLVKGTPKVCSLSYFSSKAYPHADQPQSRQRAHPPS